MDFSHIAFDKIWRDEENARLDGQKAMVSGCIFIWFSAVLLVSIIRVVSTNPGNIPEDDEWDMGEISSTSNDEFKLLIGKSSKKLDNWTNKAFEK